VNQESFSLFAKIPPVKVVPLLPPRPTSMIPSLGTRYDVLKAYSVTLGVTLKVPSSSLSTYEDLY